MYQIVVVAHGFGANNEDLVPIAHSLLVAIPNRLCFVFPNAPISLGGESRAWWPISIKQNSIQCYSVEFNWLTYSKYARTDDENDDG